MRAIAVRKSWPRPSPANGRFCATSTLAKNGRTVPLPDELAVARLVSDHVVVAFHGPARLAPAVAYDRSHAFRGVGRLMPVMAMQRVDAPVAGFDDGVVLVSIGD